MPTADTTPTPPPSEAVPSPEQVRPGLWSVPLPIPIPSLKYVVCYVFESSSGAALVDPGWDSDENLSILSGKLEQIGLNLESIRLIVATHWHGDHIGIGARLRAISGAKLAMHPLDAARLKRNEDVNETQPHAARALLAAGVPIDDIDRLIRPRYAARLPTEVDIALEDHSVLPLKDWRVRTIWTPGHTTGSVCLHDEDSLAMLTGDHVLAKISPNIAYDPGFDDARDPLAEFLDSLRRVAQVETADVLPAHLWRFDNLPARVDELLSHHEQRLSELHEAVTAGHQTTWEVARAVTWSRPWSSFSGPQELFALRETLAHLINLEHRSIISRRSGTPDRWTTR